MPLFLLLVLLFTPVVVYAQGAVEGPLPQLSGGALSRHRQLDNDAIVRMTRAELGDDIILQTIRSQPGDYRTAPDDLVALKAAGVTPAVLSAMLARNSGMQQRTPEPVQVAPLSVAVDDPGVYFKNAQGQWEQVGPELVHYRDGGALKSLVTNNIIKKDLNGVVNGPKSKLVVSLGTEMMILAPNLTDAVEYVILRFRPKSDRREFRVRAGNVFHSETGTDRDAVEIPMHKVSARLFAFTIPHDLAKGEYGVLAPGSAGMGGVSYADKIYTFSISE